MTALHLNEKSKVTAEIKGFAINGFGVIACIFYGALLGRSPKLAFVVLALVGCVVLYATKPQWMAFMAIIVTFTALPKSLPTGIAFGNFGIFFHEIVIVLAIAFLLPLNSHRRSVFSAPLVFIAVVMVSVILGMLNGNASDWNLTEAKSLVMMAAGFALAGLLIGANLVRQSILVVGVVLWYSAAAVVISASGGPTVRGRNEDLVGVTGETVGNLVRVVSWTDPLALAVLIAITFLAFSGRVQLSSLLALGFPAFIIGLLSFSRNSMLALGIAVLAALLTSLRQQVVRTSAKVVMFIVIGLLVWVVSVPLFRSVGVGGWISEQISGYSERLLGIFSVGSERDASLQFRLREVGNLRQAISEAPFLGHGFGHAYQTMNTNDRGTFFGDPVRPYFAHNFYYWIWAKAGIVGLVNFLWFGLTPVVRGLANSSLEARASATVAAAFLAISFVWPMPELNPSSIVLGIALGAATAFSRRPFRMSGVV